ncbi:MAG: hypothetical protein LBJ64_07910 [Deltaproteobacteria bacterium]|nr:hypothetical protein [Deltaproteobacteria bacterium]
MIWALAVSAYLFPWICPGLSLVLLVVCGVLAYGRPGRERLVRTAAIFWLYWTVFGLFFFLFGLAQPRPPAQLGVWLALGLILTLLWTPLELGRAWLKISKPFLGQKLSLLSSLGLVVILKSLVGLAEDASKIEKALSHRARRIGFGRKAVLFGLNIHRLASRRAEELTRALLSRKL